MQINFTSLFLIFLLLSLLFLFFSACLATVHHTKMNIHAITMMAMVQTMIISSELFIKVFSFNFFFHNIIIILLFFFVVYIYQKKDI